MIDFLGNKLLVKRDSCLVDGELSLPETKIGYITASWQANEDANSE